MSAPSADVVAELRKQYAAAGQGQVFTFYDGLPAAEQAALVQQLRLFDPARISWLAEEALHPTVDASATATATASATTSAPQLEPLPASSTASMLDSAAGDIAAWQTAGLGLVAQNKVAVVLMAGGQGTRLGSAAPKGCYDIGLPSHKSLFQIQAERILKVQTLASAGGGGGGGGEEAVVPWYIMTSGPTRGPTEAFFAEHGHFGLAPQNVVFFEQGVLPCISSDGKILLETPGRVAVAPDGNGGLYQALVASGVLADLQARGIDHVHAYCVDNCLVRVADPVFVGFAASLDVDVATKVVRKRSATEPVGLILLKNGRPDVVEYSEIDAATAEALDPAASHNNNPVLKFRAANIVNHYYSRRFLESIPQWAASLPHHVARKKIPYADLASGLTVKPSAPNGVKLEQFVFDVFPRLPLARFACLEVRREDEFSPLKNAPNTGEDDPQTSCRDILLQGRRWLEAAGATIHGGPVDGVEVSPLLSYGGEGLDRFHGQTVDVPAQLNE